jgi:hypothetical protein
MAKRSSKTRGPRNVVAGTETRDPKGKVKAGQPGTVGLKDSSEDSESGKVDKDDLVSEQFVEIIDLLCEGPIKGVVGERRGVYLEQTQVEDDRGKQNFEDTEIRFRRGNNDQSRFQLIDNVEREVPVGITLTQGSPIIRTITDVNVDVVRITINVPQMQKIGSQGKIKGSSAELEIATKYTGDAAWTVQMERKINGRTSDLYQQDYKIDLSGTFPVDIRVRRLSKDSNDPKEVNAISWSSYTEISRERLRYPNSAMVALRFSAEQFGSIPERMYLVDGLEILLPSNASVTDNGRVTYSGAWDGTFSSVRQWCCDPAWILWDLLTNTRYGTGDHIQAAQLDKWAFFAASQYANALVPDNRGGFEQRFACNVNIQTSEEAYTLINNLCSVFRAMPYWSAGALTINHDRPQAAIAQFTLANVGPEGFAYANSSLKGRPTVAVVRYMDLDAMDVSFVEVQDQAALAKWGVIKAEVEAFACTSRSQAERVGEWLLYSEWYESQTIEFTSSLEAGMVCRPGSVVEVLDPLRSGQRRGGRVVSATTTAVTVDNASDLTGTGMLTVTMADGSLEKRSVASIAGNVITTAAFSAAPEPGAVWGHDVSTVRPSLWRIVKVSEAERGKYRLSGVAYNESKYDYIERSRPLAFRDVGILNDLPPAPINLVAESVLYEENGSAYIRIVVTWESVPGVSEYRVLWRQDDDNWSSAVVSRNDYNIDQASPGTYIILVRSRRGFVESEHAVLVHVEGGVSTPPQDVTGLTLIPINEQSATLRWDATTELDVQLGGSLLIRHSVSTTGSATWENSIELVPPVGGNETEKLIPLLNGTVLVKWQDLSGNRSVNAATVTITLPTPLPRLKLIEYLEHDTSPPFDGDVVDMVYDAGLDALVLAGGGLFDELVGNIDSLAGNWDDLTGPTDVTSAGSYNFGSTFTAAPGVFDINVRRYIEAGPVVVGSLFDDRIGDIDSWPGNWDGDLVDGTDATMYVRATLNDPAGTPTWGPWQVLTNNLIRARGLQFKMEAVSRDPSQNIAVTGLGAVVELQQRVEHSGLIPAETTPSIRTITFANPFYEPPVVSINASNLGNGNYFVISSRTRTNFAIGFYNSSNVLIARGFLYTATGYGREII